MRSGAHALLLLGTPLNAAILRALQTGETGQRDLREVCGSPAQSTLRTQLRRLVEIGVLEKHRHNRFPGVLAFELSESGRELSSVGEVLERWLAAAPAGPLETCSEQGRSTIRSFTDGWSSTMFRIMAAGAHTLTELDGIISSLNYPALERRLSALRLANLVAPQPSGGRGTPYGLTAWARLGMAPLLAGIRWEQRHHPHQTAIVRQLDVETIFMLALPLVVSEHALSGSCRLGAEVPSKGGRRTAGVFAEFSSGTLSCTTRMDGDADAWALGPTPAWLNAIPHGDLRGLELGGDRPLARTVIDSLHKSLFAVADRARPA